MSVLEHLDRQPPATDPSHAAWQAELVDSLTRDPAGWADAVGDPGSETLSRNRSWILLSAVEQLATPIADGGPADLVVAAATGLSVLEASPVDRRDRMLVGSVLRNASALSGLDFESAVRRGCAPMGELGASCLEWLQHVDDRLPRTHEIVREGQRVVVRRVVSDVDVAGLERWFRGED